MSAPTYEPITTAPQGLDALIAFLISHEMCAVVVSLVLGFVIAYALGLFKK